jgi:hypothetical protein
MEDKSIVFIDEKNNRSVSYDLPVKVEFHESYVFIKCEDGFATRVSNDEWTKIEIEKW